ncbi:MAG: transcriptional repressor LexA, partial [Pyrinomonadaceae bacterium]
ILDYITQFIEEQGYEPSYQQIARRFRIASKSAIANHIAALETQGLLSRHRENGSFSLQVRPKSSLAEAVCEIQWLEIPHTNNNFEEEWEQSPLYVSKFLLGIYQPERMRAFRVPNDSMIEDHICEGDVLLVESRSFARDGDCVVAMIEKDRIVLKKFYRDGAQIELRPANPAFSTLRLPADKVSIKGIFRALLRPLG